MKKLRIFSLAIAALIGLVTACKDDSLQIVPDWETGVNGFGAFAAGSPTNFVFQDPSKELNLKLKWISIDQVNTVTKIDVFILFDEPYVDKDGNSVLARHGTANGKLLATFEGGSVPANRTDVAFKITQPQLYNLFKDNAFDYDGDSATPATPVFNNPAVPDRSPTSPFVKGDAFQIRWEFTTADGRKFYKWGVSVCTELPGSNCQVNWGVICTSDLAGTYDVVSTFDSPGYFSSTSPDFSYGPGNDGSVHDGVQTYDNVPVVVDPAGTAATYVIPDITNGFEPIMWGNPKVKALVSDQCGSLVLSKLAFNKDGDFAKPIVYGYKINPGSVAQPDGTLIIKWQNVYGENGISTFTPVDED